MKAFNRVIPVLSAIVILALLEKLLQTPRQIYWLAFIIVLFSVLSIWQLTDRRLLNKRFWQFLITPVSLLLSGILFLTFLEGLVLRQGFIFILAFALWAYFEVVYLWLHFRPKYQPHSLENISTHLNLLTLFLLSSGLLTVKIFFGLTVWPLALIFVIISALLTDQMVWASDSTFKSDWPYVMVITLAVFEIFIVVSYLPTSVYVNGLIITLSYYVMTGIARNWLLGNKDFKVLRRYLVLSLLSLIIILLTAKWF